MDGTATATPVERGRGLVELTRPINAVAGGVLTFVGAFVAGGVRTHPVPAGAAVAATVLAMGAGNAINDYFDREIDRINDPDRPIPRGAVAPREALAFSLLLFGLAVAFALTLPLVSIVIAVVNLVVLVAYTELLKGLPGVGNAAVAYLGGSTFVFGAAAVGSLSVAAGVLFALAALSTLSREIIKDVEDIAGDREEGLTTLPIAIGDRRALHVATTLLAVALVASPIPYLLGTFSLPYLLLVVPADAVMVSAAYESYSDPSTGSERLKYGMFLATAAFVAGRVAVIV